MLPALQTCAVHSFGHVAAASAYQLKLPAPCLHACCPHMLGDGVQEPDDSKLYVAHLPPHLDDDGLKRLFEAYGQVMSTRVIIERDTGASKGYGFVNMSGVREAQQAMTSLDGYKMGDKTLSVKVAGQKGGLAPPPMGPPRPNGAPSPPIMTPHGPYGVPQRPPAGVCTGAPLICCRARLGDYGDVLLCY